MTKVRYIRSADGYSMGEVRAVSEPELTRLITTQIAVVVPFEETRESLEEDIEAEDFQRSSPKDRMKRRYVKKS